MKPFFDSLALPALFAAVTGMVALRYFFFAGAFDFLLRILLGRTVQHRRIQSGFPSRTDLRREIVWSLQTILIVGIVGFGMQVATRRGWTLIYDDVQIYGLPYAMASFVGLLVAHDAYFYWAHRLMHHPRLYRWLHIVHHRSRNPSAWAALSMQPTEAVLQAAFIPIAIALVPLHSNVIFAFVVAMMWINALGHSGYELYPAGFVKSPWSWWNNTSTHHNLHHQHVDCNYGLYFNWWDRLMGTNHPRYFEIFDACTASPLFSPSPSRKLSGTGETGEAKVSPLQSS